MPNLTVSSVVDTFMQATTKAQMQAAVGAVAQLPSWTFGAPSGGVGTFTADTAQPSDTSIITFNGTPIGGVSWTNVFGLLAIGSYLVLVDSLGKPSAFNIQSIAANDPFYAFTVVPYGAITSAWSGVYTMLIIPAPQTYAQVGAASAAQGALADTALQPNAVSGTFTTITVVDGLVTGGS